MKKDERAVSPVIGVIMMIAIVVIIAAVVAAFAYGIIGGVNKAPSAAMVVEGVKPSEDPVNVSIFHHGGDTISEAFDGSGTADVWNNLEIRYNGLAINKTLPDTGYGNYTAIYLNGEETTTAWDDNFAPGDQLTITFYALKAGDTIIILHVPSESILQRLTIAG